MRKRGPPPKKKVKNKKLISEGQEQQWMNQRRRTTANITGKLLGWPPLLRYKKAALDRSGGRGGKSDLLQKFKICSWQGGSRWTCGRADEAGPKQHSPFSTLLNRLLCIWPASAVGSRSASRQRWLAGSPKWLWRQARSEVRGQGHRSDGQSGFLLAEAQRSRPRLVITLDEFWSWGTWDILKVENRKNGWGTRHRKVMNRNCKNEKKTNKVEK